MLRASSWRCAREGRVKPEVRVVAKSRQTGANYGEFRVRADRYSWSASSSRRAPLWAPRIGLRSARIEKPIAQNNPIDRWDRGLRAADMYIVSVENKRNLRTDGPHRVSGLAPTSILAIGGNFASGPPQGRNKSRKGFQQSPHGRPKRSRNGEK